MKPFLCTIAFVLVAVQSQWTTIASMPSYVDVGAAAAFGDTVFVAVLHEAHVLYAQPGGTSGLWTTVSGMPTLRVWFTMQTASTSVFYVVAGSTSITPAPTADLQSHIVEAYSLSDDQWTTKTAAPSKRDRVCGASSGTTMWLIAGRPVGTPTTSWSPIVEEYDFAADSWVTRSALPVSLEGPGGAYTDGVVAVTGGPEPSLPPKIHLYHVNADVWTTGRNPPVYRHYLYDQMAARLGEIFVYGGYPISSIFSLEKYNVAADTWTTLDAVPQAFTGGTSAMLASGYFVLAGKYIGAVDTYLYKTSTAASIVGDPVFTSFSGVATQLHLYPGVFTVLSAPGLVVNVLLDELDTLPVEENTVITMVGISVHHDGCDYHFWCSAPPQSELPSCKSLSYGLCPPFTAARQPFVLLFEMGGVAVEVLLRRNHHAYTSPAGFKWLAPTAFLDLTVQASAGVVDTVSGILGDLQNHGLSAVHHGIAQKNYENLDGDLCGF